MYHSDFDNFERPQCKKNNRKEMERKYEVEVGKRQTDKHHTNDMIVVYVILS